MKVCEPKINVKSIEKWVPKTYGECYSCHKKSFCYDVGLRDDCEWVKDFSNYNLTKPGIIIIDDNPGIVSFLEDDLKELFEQDLIDLNDYNIFTFYNKTCAYELYATIRKYGDLNIQFAIIDITLGGTIRTTNKVVKLTGVDVLEVLLELNPELKYFFYTGNQMNKHIKPIKKIMNQYTELTKKVITEDMLFKTQMNITDRQKYTYNFFFRNVGKKNACL